MISIKSGTFSQIAFTLNEKGVYSEWQVSLKSKETHQITYFILGGTHSPDLSQNVDRYNLFDVEWELEEGQYDYSVVGLSGGSASDMKLLESGRLNVEKI